MRFGCNRYITTIRTDNTIEQLPLSPFAFERSLIRTLTIFCASTFPHTHIDSRNQEINHPIPVHCPCLLVSFSVIGGTSHTSHSTPRHFILSTSTTRATHSPHPQRISIQRTDLPDWQPDPYRSHTTSTIFRCYAV